MTVAVAERKRINRTDIQLIRVDITELEVDAFVFYARSDLALGSGFGTAIALRGGPNIQKELASLAPVPTGSAVVSSAGGLKAKHIIHAVGPKFQEPDSEAKLRATVLSVLQQVEEHGFRRIALPAMGVGFYGIPLDVSARVTLAALTDHLRGSTGLDEVVLCVLDGREYVPFQTALAAIV